MTILSCPKMLRLGRLLVDAYRQYDDTAQANGPQADVRRVREQIATHRRSCQICQKIALQKENSNRSQLLA